ncbi:BTAD domain-containing putative transcriptional regulator [Kineosporia mesophila]|uniref:BTAD domain-containing putative transcriptional regulator n=1 Tax=Kineosporia mesophila TaxID=566012 RepID=UPI001E5CD4DB|nr:AAA family ATPase [Kineosporia mesophila]
MQVRVLGPLMIEAEGEPVDIGGARLRSLLVRLSADAGAWVPVSRLVQSLWLEDPPADEVNALQSLVSRLRRALPRPDLIESGPAGYRLVITKDDVDALAFENLVGQGRRTAGPPETVEMLGQALDLWRGAPLAEVADAPYAQAWTERLERLRLTAIDERAAALLTLGRAGEPVTELEEVIAAHPLRERTHELLIRALAAGGRQGEALAVYERLRRAMADELGLDPPAALQELQGQVLRDDAALRSVVSPTDPEPPADIVRRTNLRVPLTTFVGREAELAGITEQLGRTRLVTLVGTGGAGKTRLVSEVASRLADRDGVWMIELAPVTDPDDVASTVLGGIGSIDRSQLDTTLQQPPLRDVRTRLVESLAPHDAVIVLDNCEHLIEASAEVAEFLLARCPRLTVLATSREPLGIVGESIWPVRPLATAAEDSPAVQLFADRAALVRPGFTMTDENAGAVREICRRLDGLPLAIELAAARLRTLNPEALAARLDNRFRLLTGGNRTAMPRHQTLRAVVAWSWELLPDAERDLIERLSVFGGGATAETASIVCGGAEIGSGTTDFDEETIADLLLSLAEKSLLVVASGNDPQPRYRLLETIREYALEKLSERGGIATMRRAHATYFLKLAETADPYLRGRDQLFWLDRITSERDNLLASMRFAVETENADHAVRLAAALGWYWAVTSRHEESGDWAKQALRVPGESSPEPLLVVTVLAALSTAMSGKDLPGEHDLAQIDSLLQQVNVLGGHPLLTFIEPALAELRHDSEASRAAVARNLHHTDPWARAMLRLMVAMLAENEGDFERCREHIPQALAMFEEIGDRWGIATASSQLAEIMRVDGELDRAIELFTRARQLMIELHATDDEAQALVWIARIRQEKGDLEGARRDLEVARRMASETSSWMAHAFAISGAASLAAAEGNLGEARRLAEKAITENGSRPRIMPQMHAMMLSELMVYELRDNALDVASTRLALVVQLALDSQDLPVAARVGVTVAEYLLTVGRPVEAAGLLGACAQMRGHDGFRDPDIARLTARIKAALTPEEFTTCFDAGRALDREGAVALLKATTPEAAGPDRGPAASSI